MTKIEKLIAKHCPDGVEYLPLGELVDICKGAQLNRDSLSEEGAYPVINGGINPSGFWDEFNFEKDLITVSQGGASAGYVNWIPTRFWAGAHCFVLMNPKKEVLYRYVYFVVKAAERDLMQSQIGAGIPSVSVAKLASVEVPVPPIPVQEEVVRMLDGMTGLVDALENELNARQLQYEHYRRKVMGAVKEKKGLDEVCVIKNGSDYKAFGEGKYPVYGSGGIMTYVDHYAYDKPTVLIPRKGSIENFFYVDTPFWNVDTIFYTEIDTKVMEPKFLYQAMQTVDVQHLNNAGGVPSLTQTGLYTLKIPCPSLSVQKKIVKQLDAFERLCNSTTEGLPGEIAARRQQYEYYREKLLSF